MLLLLIIPCTRTEHPKLFGFVLPCDSVNFITRRTYFIKHAHTSILSLKRHYYTPFYSLSQCATANKRFCPSVSFGFDGHAGRVPLPFHSTSDIRLKTSIYSHSQHSVYSVVKLTHFYTFYTSTRLNSPSNLQAIWQVFCKLAPTSIKDHSSPQAI